MTPFRESSCGRVACLFFEQACFPQPLPGLDSCGFQGLRKQRTAGGAGSRTPRNPFVLSKGEPASDVAGFPTVRGVPWGPYLAARGRKPIVRSFLPPFFGSTL